MSKQPEYKVEKFGETWRVSYVDEKGKKTRLASFPSRRDAWKWVDKRIRGEK